MEWNEKDQRVLDNMEEWSKRIKESVFDKETIQVPHAVAIMAAVEFIVDRIGQSEVVTPDQIITILRNRFDSKDEILFNCFKELALGEN